MGQFIQDGKRLLFDTVVLIDKAKQEIVLNGDKDNVTAWNFLAGKSMAISTKKAFEGTVLAHTDGGAPNHGAPGDRRPPNLNLAI